MKKVLSILICLILITSQVFVAEAAEAPQTLQTIRVALIDSGISPIAIAARHITDGKNYALPDHDTADVIGHGTALAGLILETAPDAVLVPLVYSTRTIGGKAVQCNVKTISQIIRDAVDVYKCQVINISAGISRDVSELREAIAYAEECGVVVVAAAGNTNRITPELTYYPASYDTVIDVGALRKDGKVALFSQRHGVSLVAPGDGLKVMGLQGQVTAASGTSYAAAHVTGAVAALLTKSPGMAPAQVRQYLFKGAKDIGVAGFDADSGYGALQ